MPRPEDNRTTEREAKHYEAETPCRVRLCELLRQRASQMHQSAVKLHELADWLGSRMPADMEEILWDILHGLHPLGR